MGKKMQEKDFINAQDFILACKMDWTKSKYSSLRERFFEKQSNSDAILSVSDVEELFEDDLDYQFFGWFERHLQKMKYSGRYGLIPFHKERKDKLVDQIKDIEIDESENFQLPEYYTSIDIHQHPGGIWSDANAGFVYERGARSTTPMLGRNHRDLHFRLAEDLISNDAVTDQKLTILDMGCGFGKSTRPIAEVFPKAQVIGIDLTEPCLKLAELENRKNGISNIKYKRSNACQTELEDNSVDISTSTMLLHEMPPSHMNRMFSETFRLLKPGGRAVHLDFWKLRDSFDRFIFEGHSWRNNEPFMRPLLKMNLVDVLEKIGFSEIKISAFQEAEHIDPENCPFWRFPWTKIEMMKPI